MTRAGVLAVIIGTALFAAAAVLLGQEKGGRGIGPPAPAPSNTTADPSDNEVHYWNISIKELILRAYRIAPAQLRGPSWLDSTRLDVDGHFAPGTSREKIAFTLLDFLKNQFKLSVRRERRVMKVYLLEVAEGGPKLDRTPDWDHRPGECVRLRTGSSVCRATSASELAWRLLGQYIPDVQIGPVIDRTELTGVYDFSLEPSAGIRNGVTISGPTLSLPVVAPTIDMRRQLKPLGLTIEEHDEPVEVLQVIYCERDLGELPYTLPVPFI